MKFNEDRPFLCTRMPLISKSSATRSSSAALISDAGIASTESNEFLNTPIKRSSSSDRSKDFPSGSTPARRLRQGTSEPYRQRRDGHLCALAHVRREARRRHGDWGGGVAADAKASCPRACYGCWPYRDICSWEIDATKVSVS
jgi:hypothetical protein